MRLRWGILSTAWINDPVLEACRDSPDVEFTAVASRDAETAAAYARRRNISRAYGAYGDLLEDDDVDAVYISLPNSMHSEWAIRALRAGKHVLCEKPLSRNPADVQTAYDESRNARRHLVEAFMFRFHPLTTAWRELVEVHCGDIAYMHATHSFQIADPSSDIRTDPRLDGGALMDVGCYCVNAIRLTCGPPREAGGWMTKGTTGVDIRFAGEISCEGGALGSFICAMDLPERGRLEIVGSDATVVVLDPWHCRNPTVSIESDGELQTISATQASTLPWGDAYRFEFEAMGHLAERPAPDLAIEQDALVQAATINALFQAATERRRIAF